MRVLVGLAKIWPLVCRVRHLESGAQKAWTSDTAHADERRARRASAAALELEKGTPSWLLALDRNVPTRDFTIFNCTQG